MAAILGLCDVAEPTDAGVRATPGPDEPAIAQTALGTQTAPGTQTGPGNRAHESANCGHLTREICQAYAALAAPGPTVSPDEHGWDRPTRVGLASEAAVRAVGGLIAAKAAQHAAPAIEAAHRRFTELDRRAAAIGGILANAYQRALGEIRPMGPGCDRVRTVRATRTLAQLLTQVAAHYPREWITANNSAHDHPGDPSIGRPHGLYLTRHPARASYDAGSTITRTLSANETVTFAADVLFLRSAPRGWRRRGYAVACHEFSHRCEHLKPRIGDLSRVFVARRAIDPVTGKREPLLSYPDSEQSGPTHADHVDYSATEWVQPSGLIDSYMGKIYRNRRYHEILSTGMEALFAGSYGGLIGEGDYRADLEHRDFVLGLLAVV